MEQKNYCKYWKYLKIKYSTWVNVLGYFTPLDCTAFEEQHLSQHCLRPESWHESWCFKQRGVWGTGGSPVTGRSPPQETLNGSAPHLEFEAQPHIGFLYCRVSQSGCRDTLGCLGASPGVPQSNLIVFGIHQHHFSKFNHLHPLLSKIPDLHCTWLSYFFTDSLHQK